MEWKATMAIWAFFFHLGQLQGASGSAGRDSICSRCNESSGSWCLRLSSPIDAGFDMTALLLSIVRSRNRKGNLNTEELDHHDGFQGSRLKSPMGGSPGPHGDAWRTRPVGNEVYTMALSLAVQPMAGDDV